MSTRRNPVRFAIALASTHCVRQRVAVLVDDLSRLSRDNHFLADALRRAALLGVRIVSRADCLDSEDRHSKLGFQMRGIVNELYLDDLREKTLRGQLGQKARGFTVGEATFGYRSVPVGEMRVDRRGRPRPKGYRMTIDASEAAVVQRIFAEFADGTGINTIVKALNREEIKGRRKAAGGWTPSTVSRILRNEKYIGRWAWNRTETRRDPRTGRKRRHAKVPSEWHISESEALRIVPQATWDRVVTRWQEIDRAWPIPKSRRSRSERQRSYVETHPPHLLAGMLRCAACSNTIAQVSGKGGGYYGCLTAVRHACANRLLVRRRIAEAKLLAAVRDRLGDTEAIHSVLCAIGSEIRRLCADLPENLKLKRAALATEERKISNFVEFIGEGKGSGALAQALATAEQQADLLRNEIRALETANNTIFEPPPFQWVTERLANLQSTLDRDTGRSALLLRRVLGPVVLPAQATGARQTALRSRNDPPGRRSLRRPGGWFELVA
jgi:DNA invertase Pin-like site-specific DNA recombinase